MALKKDKTRTLRDDINLIENDKSTEIDSSFVSEVNENIDNTPSQNQEILTEEDSDKNEIIEDTKSRSKKGLKVRKTKKDSNYEKKTFIKRIKTLVTLIVLGVFTGSGMGVWYFNTVLRSTVDYEALFLELDKYTMNVDNVFKDTLKITSEEEKANWVSKVKSEGKDPTDFTPIENMALAEWNASHSSSFVMIGNGWVETLGIKQAVNSCKKFNGEAYTYESISSGVVTVAILDYMKLSNQNKISLYTSNKPNGDDTVWNYNEDLTRDDYLKLVGGPLNTIQPYIISPQTVLSSTPAVYNEESGYYTFSFELDKVLSVIKYARQVRRTGGLGSYPEFSKVSQTITIDSDWNIVNIEIYENYSAVAMGMKVGCKGYIMNTFKFNGDVTLNVQGN